MSTSSQDTPKKGRKDKNDPSRFHSGGVNFKAKLIGVEYVEEARGDKMCQETIQKLKGVAKNAGGHKQRICVNVSLDGLKILEEKSGAVVHQHAVHKISFIARDITDTRAFGYVYGPGDGTHEFFGIKTDKAAEGLVMTLRDLFQVVFEMKKKEVEDAKKQQDAGENKENEENRANIAKANLLKSPKREDNSNADNTSPAVDDPASAVGNLLDLESELESINKGLQQMDAFGSQWVGSGGGGGGGSVQSSPGPAQPQLAGGASAAAAWAPQSSAQPAQFAVSFDAAPSAMGSAPAPASAAAAAAAPHPAFIATFPQSTTTQQRDPFAVSSGSGALYGSSPVTQQHQMLQQRGLPQPGGTPPALPRPNTMPAHQTSGPGPAWATFDSPSPPSAPAGPAGGAQFGTPPMAANRSTGAQAPAQTNQNQSFGGSFSVQGDPFKTDPFFSSTPSGGATAANAGAQPREDRYSVFSEVSQQSFSANLAQSGSSFGDSSMFGTAAAARASPTAARGSPAARASPALGRSGMNEGFAATPFMPPHASPQLQRPTPPPTQESSPAKQHDPFSDLVGMVTDTPLEGRRNFTPPPVAKPTLLALSQNPPKVEGQEAVATQGQGQQPAALLGIPQDPFGGPVSPTTDAQLDKIVAGPVERFDDPFDTSSIVLPPARGPYDSHQLTPHSLDKSNPSSHEEVSVSCATTMDASSDKESSPESGPALPSPEVSPPPLPSQATFSADAPPPPPRPGSGGRSRPTAAHFHRQATIDVADMTPPPVPRRPGSGRGGGSASQLIRQATVQFPMEESSAPTPPPRPVGGLREHAPVSRAQSVPSPPPFSAAPPQAPSAAPRLASSSAEEEAVAGQHSRGSATSTTDPFAVSLTQSRPRSGSQGRPTVSAAISRPRPRSRARPKTPAGTSSGLSFSTRSDSPLVAERPSSSASAEYHMERHDSFSSAKHAQQVVSFNAFSSHLSENSTDQAWNTSSKLEHSSLSTGSSTKDRSDTPSGGSSTHHNEGSISDPFANVDPFAKTDPFNGLPDPFAIDSPSDPFSKDFSSETQVFTTKAVTIEVEDPFADDPFAKDPFKDDPFTATSASSPRSKLPSASPDNQTTPNSSHGNTTTASQQQWTSFTDNSPTSDSPISKKSDKQSESIGEQKSENDPFALNTFLSSNFFSNQFNSFSNVPNGNGSYTNEAWAFMSKENSDKKPTVSVAAKEAARPGESDLDSVDGFSSSLSAPNLPNSKDVDSSSNNSEIVEAFGEDGISHTAAAAAAAAAAAGSAQPWPSDGNSSHQQLGAPSSGNPFA